MKLSLRWVAAWVVSALVAACSGTVPTADGSPDHGNPGGGDTGSTASGDAGTGVAVDSGAPGPGTDGASPGSPPDAGTPPAPSADSGTPAPQPDAAPPPPSGDGTPTRQPCTGNFGNALTSTHGRIDGYIVSIVNVGGSKTCNGDSSHLHLQVKMNGAIYDVAVNVDTLVAERDIPLPDGAWSEGWHTTDALDYAKLGLHSSDFTRPSSPSALAQQIESELANVNHISVFATGYGPTGAHLVHRNGGGNDGAIVTQPLSGQAHVIMFTFTTSGTF